MKPVFIHSTQPNNDPQFIKTETVTFTRGDKLGSKMHWERIKSKDTVHILVYNITTEKYLLVKQHRIPVLVNNPGNEGVIECCAGLIDKYPNIEDEVVRATMIAKEEVLEELGYDVKIHHINYLGKNLSGVGSSGNTQYLFRVNVLNSEFVGQQLEETEDIDVIELDKLEVYYFLKNNENTDLTTKYMLSTVTDIEAIEIFSARTRLFFEPLTKLLRKITEMERRMSKKRKLNEK